MITKKYTSFFKQLAQHNNKDWFHENKKTYEQDVKKPFLNLLEILIPEIELLEPEISTNPKDALFRINRDVRFSKDKTPYNTLLKAGFSAGGRKSVLPGYYLGISAEKIHVGGGLFNVKTHELKKIRKLIAKETELFNTIVNNKDFVQKFGTLKGEKAKRLDASFQSVQAKMPYIANKQFYAMQEIPLEQYYCSDELPKMILMYFKEINPLNKFLKKAFK